MYDFTSGILILKHYFGGIWEQGRDLGQAGKIRMGE